MVRIVQVMFSYGTVTEEILWATMVLLPTGEGGYRSIGVVEELCKMCSVVYNCCLKRSAVLHDALHGFREGRGAGTVTLEAKLEQKLSGILRNLFF